jgi:hypothetical protein
VPSAAGLFVVALVSAIVKAWDEHNQLALA